ncbi:50S ribosomal protein L20 [Roseobacter sp. SK209-2-6]|uniref:hypothetical protein n=1 Tax=Roseobacter sp. SK209-2-6 TaxID=388739 RepID=UPI0000F3EFA1|nr:hypothetical protein [Roseobacter sp. SK209-2-6]EBA16763.1 50S ribosomal protein L20 [Roseobacter sp. SK209-2-6]
MKLWTMCIAGAVLLAGCSGGNSVSIVTKGGSDAAIEVTKPLIETCWKQAGIKSDLYKFLTPQEAVGLRAGGVVSKEQKAAFDACLKA